MIENKSMFLSKLIRDKVFLVASFSRRKHINKRKQIRNQEQKPFRKIQIEPLKDSV